MNRQIVVTIISLLFLESCVSSPICKMRKHIIFHETNISLPKYLCGMELKFTPTIEEIYSAESIICTDKSSFNKRLYDLNLSKYNRQYYGLLNSNNDKVIVINLLHKRLFKDKKGNENIYFKSEFSQGFGGEYEKYARVILVNIDKNISFFPCEK